jgi:predicted SnoaL-like aldol condensation-catalyzing enzyme
MMKTIEETNKKLVLEAFDTLFNKRNYQEAERFWSPNYIQHSAHIKPGRDGLFDLIRSSPATLRYEPGTIVAEGDYVIVHGRELGLRAVNSAARVRRVVRNLGSGRRMDAPRLAGESGPPAVPEATDRDRRRPWPHWSRRPKCRWEISS